jgi:hypothetical protein
MGVPGKKSIEEQENMDPLIFSCLLLSGAGEHTIA